jgi:hypothetical protein
MSSLVSTAVPRCVVPLVADRKRMKVRNSTAADKATDVDEFSSGSTAVERTFSGNSWFHRGVNSVSINSTLVSNELVAVQDVYIKA